MYEKLVQAMIDAEKAYWADGPIPMNDEWPPLPFHGVPGQILIDAMFNAWDQGIKGELDADG